MHEEEFADSVLRRIDDGRGGRRARPGRTRPLGHPRFRRLRVGATGTTDGVALYLDLRRFTARSVWDTPEAYVRVNVAVLTELASCVELHGGHVLGFRGDGVFACFDGADQDPAGIAQQAVCAAGWAMNAVQQTLNAQLQASGIEPVEVHAGLDYGRMDFVRIGSWSGSEVNVLGFAANFASKCEKVAREWELIAGQRMAELLPSRHVRPHGDPPISYQRDGKTFEFGFYYVAASDILDESIASGAWIA